MPTITLAIDGTILSPTYGGPVWVDDISVGAVPIDEIRKWKRGWKRGWERPDDEIPSRAGRSYRSGHVAGRVARDRIDGWY